MADKHSFKIPKKVKISKKILEPAKKQPRRNIANEENEIFAKNRIEDVRWLCSLSESELDLLISIKTLIIRRATVAGHESLVEKFDFNMLRVLSYALMEHCKEEMKGSFGGDAWAATCLGRSNLSRVRLGEEEEFGGMGVEELMGYLKISKSRGGGGGGGGEVDEDIESMGVDENEMMGFVDKRRFAEMFSEDDLGEPVKRKKSNCGGGDGGGDEELVE